LLKLADFYAFIRLLLLTKTNINKKGHFWDKFSRSVWDLKTWNRSSAAKNLNRVTFWYGQSIGNGLQPKFWVATWPFPCEIRGIETTKSDLNVKLDFNYQSILFTTGICGQRTIHNQALKLRDRRLSWYEQWRIVVESKLSKWINNTHYISVACFTLYTLLEEQAQFKYSGFSLIRCRNKEINLRLWQTES
jgi:hypothetical protein